MSLSNTARILSLFFASVGTLLADSTQMTTLGIATGQNQALVLRSDGSVWVWGTNQVGEMGIANVTQATFPLRVPGVSNGVSVAAGFLHSILAEQNGTVWTWGANNGGQLGTGNYLPTNVPVQALGITNAIGVSAGDSYSLALLANGKVMSWGTNNAFQLGNGTSTTTNKPVFVSNLTNIIKVVAGRFHGVALDVNGVVWTWGYGNYGALGRGNNSSSSTPASCLSNVVDIAAGQVHTIALKKDGTVWVWGNNQDGQLGIPSITTGTNVPVLVLSNAQAIGAGFDCSATTLSNGQNMVWGYFNGQITAPVSLSPAPPFAKYALGISAASLNLALGMTANGAVWAWGVNEYGAFGTGNITSPFDSHWELYAEPSFAPTPPARWGEFIRGNTYDFSPINDVNFCSVVVPIDLEQGVQLNPTGSDAYCYSNTLPWFLCISNQALYLPTSISSGTNLNVFPVNNPVAAFGSQGGGSVLNLNQPYRFGVYAGGFDESTDAATNVIKISVYDRTLFNGSSTNIAPLNTFTIPLPRRTIVADSNAWYSFMTNGASATVTSNGLTTTVEFLDNETISNKPFGLTWITGQAMTNYFLTGYKLTHTASTTNYFYKVEVLGKVQVAATTLALMATNASGVWSPTPLYTLDFAQPNPLQSVYVSRLFFNGTPKPPTYEQAAFSGPNGIALTITNIALTNSTYTNLDNTPELRRSPVLDQFVADMNNDPLALASYVINEIELTDPYAAAQKSSTVNPYVNCGGVDRSALGTYLEGQGSPIEQCELLVYLLRQAGYPAAYVFPTNNNLGMMDSHISQLWRVQVDGVINVQGIPAITNSLLTVNYPWVVANIGTNTVHIFPWLKDTSIEEGVNLYDYMPTNYNTALKWVENYVRGDSNILSLDSENVVSKLFPEFVQQYLNPQDPTFSLDALGVRAYNRRHQFPTWAYLPQPDLITNVGTVSVVDTLTNTSSFPYLANMFNTVQVQVYSNSPSGTLLLNSGVWYSCDYDNRKLLLFTNNGQLCLWLAPYRTNVSTVQSFAGPSSVALQSNSVATGTLTSLAVQTIHHRKIAALSNPYTEFPDSDSTGSTNLSHCNMGDTAAIAIDCGRVTPLMLQQHAETYWGLQRQRAANTNFVPNVWDYKGTAAYLLGMGYFQKNDAFDIYNQQWHKVHSLIKFSAGLGVIGVCPTLTNMQAKVDMFNNLEVYIGNGSLRPDSGVPEFSAVQNYLTLNITAGSAQEHDILQTMFPDQGAISTVRLLQLAQARATNGNSPILELVNNNVVSAGNLTYGGYPGPLKSQDPSVWASVTNIFTQTGGDFTRVLITPAMITNATKTYIGMGALIFSYTLDSALISGNVATLNGGWGSEQPGFYTPVTSGSTLSMDLNSGPAGFTFTPINPSGQNVITTPNLFDLASGSSQINNVWSPQINLQSQQTFSLLGGNGGTGAGQTLDGNAAPIGPTDAGQRSYGQIIAEPVNVTSGEFYVDATDLSLPGPFPLDLRRNYTSQNLQCNELGYGWKMNFNPSLVVGTNATIIYAAELDGTVLAYHLTNGVWKVLSQDNPTLNNNSTYGVGSAANLFNSVLRTNNSTNYVISAPDGSTRTYQTMSFPITTGTNTMSRTRPYLTQWQDHAGNYALFFYGTNLSADDWGQLNRINMANGNALVFKYDFYGRIIQAISGDGRFVNYQYDNYGDLVTVTLPDASQCQYQYQHYTFTTNSTTYTDSLHLISQEIKPNGRIVANYYDSLRRVTNQASTVGTNLVLTTNAYFYYTNNITSLTNQLASGTTRVEDFFHNPTLYYYTNNLIINTVDPLGKSTIQVWFPDNGTNLPGFYPKSLQYTIDKRGLTNQYFYDTNGNVTQIVVMGNLTGEGIFNQGATNTYTYTTNNLTKTTVDPAGNGMQFSYGSTDPFQMTQAVRTSGATTVFTNLYFYTNVGSSAFGMISRQVQAGATNDYTYDSHGFRTSQIQYPTTTDNPSDPDPAVIHYFSYNLRGQMYQDQIAGGGTTQADYDPMGRITARRLFDQGNNNVSTEYFYYNQDGELEWYDGARSNPEDYVYHIYDGAGREIQQVNFRSQGKIDGSGVEAPAGNAAYSTIFRTFDGFGNPTSVTDARGVVTTNQFDALGQLLQKQVFDANGTLMKTEKFAYEPGGLVTIATNALGGTNQTLYTQTGKPYRNVGPDGATNGTTYYLDGRPKREYLANGSFWQSTYDDVNLLITRVFYNAGGTPLETNIAGSDHRGNQILRVDGAGNSFTNVFDGLNRVKLTAGPMTVNIQTNLPGNPSGGGNQTNIYQQTSTNYYDAAGLAATNFDALGNSTITYLDVLGRVIDKEVRDPANNLVRITTTLYSADHQSQTVTQGTGASAIVQTIYTDNAGKPVLTISYPSSGVREFILDQYDLAENLISETQNSVSDGAVTTWTTASFVNDGLNRVTSKTDRDSAVTTYGFDAASDLTTRTMPGGLIWQAAYNSARQKLYDCNVGSGSSVTRSNNYAYSSTTGLLQSATDGRGVTCTHYYDAFLRPASNVYSGPLPEHNMTTSWNYDPRNLVTNISEGFASSGTGPSMSVTRQFDGYSELVNDTISGGASSAASQGWDAAGRRTGLGIAGGGFSFGYQADGLLTSISGGSYTYSTSGLLASRAYSPRVTTISQRDGDGRPLAVSTTVNGTTVLSETATYLGDGLMASHTLVRSDFTDNRSYTYANLSRRLTQETVGLSASSNWTTAFTYDSGVPGGPGVLTSMGQAVGTNVHWNGGVDGFSRVSVGTNSVAQRQAYGFLNGTAIMTALLDGNRMPVTTVGTNDNYEWRAQLQLSPGAHQLIVNALNWSGYYTASATNTFTNNAADRALDSYAGNGEITNRVWLTAGGLTNATESLSFDARDRLHSVTYLDSNTNGYTWSAIYDGLGRRMSTTTTFITNGVVQTNFTRTIGQYFDPQVQFLEVAENDGGVTTLKFYGPDINGVYGGVQGVGGLEAVVSGPSAASPVINDMRGNALALDDLVQGAVVWSPGRVTAYGAAPGYAPLPLGDGAKVTQASAWRGKWADITGLLWIGNRYYSPTEGRWLSFDQSWNETDPNGFTFCGGQPVTAFDPDGRLGRSWVQQSQGINVNGVGSFLEASFLGAAGSILQGVGSTPSVFNQAAQGMANANQQISTYTGGQAFLANTLALPANFAFGTTALVNNPVNTVSQIPGAIAQLPGNIANNVQNFANNPSISGGFSLLQNGLQVAGLVEGGASLLEGASGLIPSDIAIANPIPTTVARVIPNGINATTLGAPGVADVFVADASQLQGLNAQQIAARLGIPESPTGFQVIQFPTPSGLASPVFRSNPGFVGGGLTSGGASEFVIPNGPIPSGATTIIVH
jgi:RHS repeat-associated protein